MPTLPEVIVTMLLPFEHLFDPRTWRKAQLLVVGAILSPGKRTVSSALNILGVGQHGDFALYHQVLNRARCSTGPGAQPGQVVAAANEPGAVAAGGWAPGVHPTSRWFSVLTRRWSDVGAGRLRPRGATGMRSAPRTTRW